jgi:antitoxin StbD
MVDTNLILAEVTASISELKKNPMGIVQSAEGSPVAILNRNELAFYCVPAEAYENLLEQLEDLQLNAIADKRKRENVIKIYIDDVQSEFQIEGF